MRATKTWVCRLELRNARSVPKAVLIRTQAIHLEQSGWRKLCQIRSLRPNGRLGESSIARIPGMQSIFGTGIWVESLMPGTAILWKRSVIMAGSFSRKRDKATEVKD